MIYGIEPRHFSLMKPSTIQLSPTSYPILPCTFRFSNIETLVKALAIDICGGLATCKAL